MEKINSEILLKNLQKYIGHKVFIHLEINPGAYFRNGNALLNDCHVKGEGNYRVFLQFDDNQAIIHVDNVTDMNILEEQIILIGYDEFQRLARTLEISLKPFSM